MFKNNNMILVYYLKEDKKIIFGVATNEKGVKKIKREAVNVCINDYYSNIKSFSIIKQILNDIFVVEINSNELTNGIGIVLN